MHLVEDRRVLHHLPTSAGVPAAAGSGGGVGVGAHGGSRFSSRLRGGPGSGGGDKGSEPARPGRMGQATAVNARVVLAGVRDRRDGQGPGWRCVHPRPAGAWSGHRSDHDEQFRSPGARGLGRDHQERLSKLQSGLQGAGFRRWYPECGHRPAQLRGAGQRRGPGTRAEGPVPEVRVGNMAGATGKWS